jgi:RimJ/RimL family protein N-acetyltransferase
MSIFFEVNPVTLEGNGLRMEPLAQEHAQGLFNRGQNSGDWDYMARACFVDMADTRQWIDEALCTSDQVPFAIVETAKGKVVGSTRYMNIHTDHKSLEIGWTWLGQEWQRTHVNTDVKLLLLSHAFERLGCLRVEFKTDERNLRSQRALERIGATREGVLRQHMVVQKDFSRNSVYFSVIDSEWPEVKERLVQLRNR